MANYSSPNDTENKYIALLNSFDNVRDITTKVFTDDTYEIETEIINNNIDNDLWSINDFVTMENQLVNKEGKRVSSMCTTSSVVKNSDINPPTFNPDTGELENAMIVQGNVPVSSYLKQVKNDDDIKKALAKQLRFGLDSASGVMKNCIAAHNVIHSLLLSLLVYFRTKIVKSSFFVDNEEGNVMMFCRIMDTLAEISAVIKKAKNISYKLADGGGLKDSVIVGEKYIDLTRAKLPSKCTFCNITGHGTTPIVEQFSDRLQKEYIKRNKSIIEEKRNAVQKGGLTDIFITRSGNAASTAAIQHNYDAEQSSMECAFKRAKFDSQVDYLIKKSYSEDIPKPIDAKPPQSQTLIMQYQDQLAPPPQLDITVPTESSIGSPSHSEEITNEPSPIFKLVQRTDAKPPQSHTQKLIMQYRDQLAPPPQLDITAPAELSEKKIEEFVKKNLPQFIDKDKNILSEEAMMKVLTQDKELPTYIEMMRPLPFLSPISPNVLESETEKIASEMGREIPPISPTIASVLEPSQSETEKIASDIHKFEMLGYSPSLPAILDRDRRNRTSMRMAVKKKIPKNNYYKKK